MTSKPTHVSDVVKQAKAERIYSDNNEADYIDWARATYWTPEQAVALTFGLNPIKLNWDMIDESKSNAGLAQKIFDFHKRLLAAIAAGDVPASPFRPFNFVDWLSARKFLAPKLAQAVEEYGQPIEYRRYRVERLEQQVTLLQEQVRNLQEGSNSDAQNIVGGKEEKPIETQERNTFYKIMLGMAIHKFGYKPGAARNDCVGDICEALESCELRVGRQTISDKLSDAVTALEYS